MFGSPSLQGLDLGALFCPTQLLALASEHPGAKHTDHSTLQGWAQVAYCVRLFGPHQGGYPGAEGVDQEAVRAL